MKTDFKPIVDHRFNLRADWGAVDCEVLAVEPNKTLSYTWDARDGSSEERGDLDSHANEHGDPPAHGTVRLPVGSAAGLPGRQVRMAEVPCQSGAGLGAAD